MANNYPSVRSSKMNINNSFEVADDPLTDVFFSDEKGIIYTIYTSLSHLKVSDSTKDLDSKTLYIGSKAFPIKDNLSFINIDRNGVYLNLSALLGFKERLSTSQVLSLSLRNPNEKKGTVTNLVYLSRYILAKDPRKEENKGHLSLILDTLVLDFPYQRNGNTSNLVVKIDGKKLHLLLM